jgi:hypothetical protein
MSKNDGAPIQIWLLGSILLCTTVLFAEHHHHHHPFKDYMDDDIALIYARTKKSILKKYCTIITREER